MGVPRASEVAILPTGFIFCPTLPPDSLSAADFAGAPPAATDPRPKAHTLAWCKGLASLAARPRARILLVGLRYFSAFCFSLLLPLSSCPFCLEYSFYTILVELCVTFSCFRPLAVWKSLQPPTDRLFVYLTHHLFIETVTPSLHSWCRAQDVRVVIISERGEGGKDPVVRLALVSFHLGQGSPTSGLVPNIFTAMLPVSLDLHEPQNPA